MRQARLDDCPGKATISPNDIEITAAVTEISIVFPIPDTKNFMFIHPEGVVGLITYQPQISEEQLQSPSNAKSERQIFFIFSL